MGGFRRRSRRPLRSVFAAAGLIAVLLAGLGLPLGAEAAKPGATQSTTVGVKQYYLALGDSMSFGYQPNWDFSHGFTQQWYSGDLQARGSQSYTNYACNGETSTTFINGGCRYAILLHNYYAGSQLSAALRFIQAHPGQVSPVSFDIGANDLLPDINSSTCTVDTAQWNSDMQTLSQNLDTILSQLTQALTNKSGARTGDLIMMNYYNPYQNACGASTDSYVQQLNSLMAQKAQAYAVPVANVYAAFGSSNVGSNTNLCSYTWMCSSYDDIHPTGGRWGEPGNGYGVIASTIKNTIGY